MHPARLTLDEGLKRAEPASYNSLLSWLWEGWKDPANGEWLRICTTITGEQTSLCGRFTPGCRVILLEEHHDAWLSGKAGKEALVPFPGDRMKE